MSRKRSPFRAPSAVPVPGYLAGRWKVDPVHSEIGFSVRQLMISTARGRFTGYDVTIVTGGDPLDSSVAVTIELASIDTGNTRRDHHLCSAAYLDAATQPTMSYRSTGVRRAHDGWIVDGELTLRGVTRPVPLAVEMNGFRPGADGGMRAGFSATAQLNRSNFGVVGGRAVVSDNVSISIELEAVLER